MSTVTGASADALAIELGNALVDNRLAGSDKDFARSLLSYYKAKGYWSTKQAVAARNLVVRASGTAPTAISKVPALDPGKPEAEIVNARKLKELFDKAATKLKYPSISLKGLPITSGTLRVYLSAKSPSWKDHILFRSSTQDLDNRVYAAIDPAGKGKIYYAPFAERLRNGTYTKEANTGLANAIRNLMLDPTTATKMNGIAYGACCFCGQELTNPSSVYHGYGPICAGNFGLPWGDVPEEELPRITNEKDPF